MRKLWLKLSYYHFYDKQMNSKLNTVFMHKNFVLNVKNEVKIIYKFYFYFSV